MTHSRTYTIYKDEEGGEDKAEKARKERDEADDHVHNYVQDQLKRLMSPDGPDQYQDEIEAQYDGM